MTVEKKYVVPEEGRRQARMALTGGVLLPIEDRGEVALDRVLLEFIQWQAENPKVPTRDEMDQLIVDWDKSRSEDTTRFRYGGFVAVEWQRRMYLAPQPPAEEKKPEIVRLLEGRQQEYSDWLAENLERAAAGIAPLPRLDWDKPKRGYYTYGELKASMAPNPHSAAPVDDFERKCSDLLVGYGKNGQVATIARLAYERGRKAK